MAKQEKLDNPESNPEENTEENLKIEEMSEELKKMAENMENGSQQTEGGATENHEHNHEEEAKKTIAEIRERIQGASEPIKKIAEGYLERTKDEKLGAQLGLGELYKIQNDLTWWVKDPKSEDGKIASLPDLSEKERNELYEVLYGENTEGETLEEIKNQREERDRTVAERQKKIKELERRMAVYENADRDKEETDYEFNMLGLNNPDDHSEFKEAYKDYLQSKEYKDDPDKRSARENWKKEFWTPERREEQRKQESEALEKRREENARAEERKKAEEEERRQKNKRWLGLGRFFK